CVRRRPHYEIASRLEYRRVLFRSAAVVKTPRVEILSSTAKGIPDITLSASIPFSSIAAACARADSSATVMNESTADSRSLISSRVALVNSTAEISLLTRRLCNSSIDLLLNDIKHLLRLPR